MNKTQLFRELGRQGVLKKPEIREAFKQVDRTDFVLPEFVDQAYENHPLPIGFGQTISQPYTVAFMLDLLAPKRGEKILDIGCGSGWTTALLASIAGKEGRVIGVERISELAKFAESNIAKYPLLQRTSTIVRENGSKGYNKETPFDRILASAAVFDDIPEAWKAQLKIGGRIVAPVRDLVVLIDKLSADKYRQKEHWGFVFVPLVGD
ncbi:MAG: protein-L-isoaspartate O-methyltransferase [Candidatus Doudnabacteria bacterium]|nr:protein-L-isoaspartate O-methyltransferase [Candidatus Doudnabacteria bacterium]